MIKCHLKVCPSGSASSAPILVPKWFNDMNARRVANGKTSIMPTSDWILYWKFSPVKHIEVLSDYTIEARSKLAPRFRECHEESFHGASALALTASRQGSS